MDPDQTTSPLQEAPETTPTAPEPPVVTVPEPEPAVEIPPEPVPTLDLRPSTFDSGAPSAPEPTIEIPAEPAPPEPQPSSEPLTEVSNVAPQGASQGSTSGQPATAQEPEPEPTQAEPLQISDINSQILEPPVPSPTLDLRPLTFDLSSLTDEQLKAASALYAKKNQKALSQKGVEKRQAIANENIQNITSFISTHSPASNRTIARALNLPPRRVQHYMQILTHNGTVTATGWGASRQYFKK